MAEADPTGLATGMVDAAEIGRIFREDAGRSVATLIRVFGDIDVAEDAVQDAYATALKRWPVDGLPPNPGAWITMTARNRAIDRLRRSARERELLGEIAQPATTTARVVMSEEVGPVQEDRLRLIFTCCHPALAPDARVALTLRLLGGLTTAEVATGFLVPEATMAKRLTRAKHKIKAAHIPYRVPDDHELPARLPAALAVIYLTYNAGLDGRGDSPLCAEAIRLARLLAALMPDEMEVAGLMALCCFSSKRGAHPGPRKTARPFSWLIRIVRIGNGIIDEAQAIVRECLRRDRAGLYQIQAAINAVHADAATFDATDWSQIVALYDMLLAIAPTPVVALNRAIAVGEVDGPVAALALVDALDLDSYHAFHATRADLLWRLDRRSEALTAFERAAALAPTEAERVFLRDGGRMGLRSPGTARG